MINLNRTEIEQKLNKILDYLDSFCASVEVENRFENSEIAEIVEKIKKIKTSKEDDGKATKEKTIGFCMVDQFALYLLIMPRGKFQFLVNFCRT